MAIVAASVVPGRLAAPARAGGGSDVQPPRYVALMIGIDDYRDGSGLKDLVGPTRDIEAIGNQLKGSCGFEVNRLKDEEATAQGIKAAIELIGRTLRPEDNLLIWYAGHGQHGQDGAPKQEGYWLPQDANAADKSTWLSFDALLVTLSKIPEGRILLVSDSCFSGGLSARPPGRKHLQIITSGPLEEVPDTYGVNGFSPFAEDFKAALSRLETNYLRTRRKSMRAFGDIFAYILKSQSSGREPTRWPEPGVNERAADDDFEFPYKAAQLTRAEAAKMVPGEFPSKFTRRTEGRLTFYRMREGPDTETDMVLIGLTRNVKVGPQYPATDVAPFLVDRDEVTVGKFRRFLNDTGPLPGLLYWNLRGYDDDAQPVVGVTFGHARAYAAWAGKDLPTEAEWQAAAQGIDPLTSAPDWQPFAPKVVDPSDVTESGIRGLKLGVREWCWTIDMDHRRAAVRGASVVAWNLNERNLWRDWSPTSGFAADPTIPRNNVGFRCVKRMPRK